MQDALVLLVERSRRLAVPPTRVELPDRELRLGAADADWVAELTTDVATLIRLCSGRHPDPARFRLDGAGPEQYHLFR
jgi:hypothetical protein